jgi:hypothetical protein
MAFPVDVHPNHRAKRSSWWKLRPIVEHVVWVGLRVGSSEAESEEEDNYSDWNGFRWLSHF